MIRMEIIKDAPENISGETPLDIICEMLVMSFSSNITKKKSTLKKVSQFCGFGKK